MARKTPAEMIGEAFREVGVLLALFAPLEQLVVKGESVTPAFAFIVVILVGLLLGFGIGIERRREP